MPQVRVRYRFLFGVQVEQLLMRELGLTAEDPEDADDDDDDEEAHVWEG